MYAVTVNEDTPFAVQARQCGALVIVGDATTSAVRRGTRLADASEAFIATGDDARNLALAGELLSDLNSGQIPSRQTLRCYVHVSSPTLTASLAEHRWSQAGHRNVSFQIFNVDEQDARDGLLSEGRGLLEGPVVRRRRTFHRHRVRRQWPGDGAPDGEARALQELRAAAADDRRPLWRRADAFSRTASRLLSRSRAVRSASARSARSSRQGCLGLSGVASGPIQHGAAHARRPSSTR